ncbi:MAG: ThuA domain-containing protein [Ilumatobacteraceae bacterium]|nr:ThuA domain-containing protein [Ilumatobacteraceae bacterium]
MSSIAVTWIVGGHPYDEIAFQDMLNSLLGVESDVLKWPHAEELFTVDAVEKMHREGRVLALYDLPGIRFNRGSEPNLVAPSPEIIEAWRRITQLGIPILAMHHAIASWPTWPLFAEILKGRFHYVPAKLRGQKYIDSGWANPVHQVFDVLLPAHPICDGLPESFDLTDETYLCPIFEDEVTPLIATRSSRESSQFSSAYAAIRREEQGDWFHQEESRLVAWTHKYEKSSVVYLQPGDGPLAFTNEHYRKLISNTLYWLNDERVITNEE